MIFAVLGGALMTVGAVLMQPKDREVVRKILIAWILSAGVILCIYASVTAI